MIKRTEGPWSLNDVQYWSNKGMWAVPPKGSLYQGGYYIADITYGDGRQFGLILSPKSGGEEELRWRTSTATDTDMSSEDDGLSNSFNMNNANFPAGNFCRSLSIGGYTDWYLPAKNELTAIWDYRTNIPSTAAMTVISPFWYWSSTQHINGGSAWIRRFNSDGETNAAKNNPYLSKSNQKNPIKLVICF